MQSPQEPACVELAAPPKLLNVAMKMRRSETVTLTIGVLGATIVIWGGHREDVGLIRGRGRKGG